MDSAECLGTYLPFQSHDYLKQDKDVSFFPLALWRKVNSQAQISFFLPQLC